MAKKTFNEQKNKLIHQPKQPYNAPPMGLFDLSDVEPAVDWALEKARENIQTIADNPDSPGFENTIHALAFADEDLSAVLRPFTEMLSASNTEEVQKLWEKVSPKLTEFRTEVILNKKLFERVRHVYDHTGQNSLSTEQRTLLVDTYNGFKYSGAELSGQSRQAYKSLVLELADLTRQFGNNLVNSASKLKVVVKEQDKDRLKGIPEDIIATYRDNAKNDKDPNITGRDYVIKMTPPPMDVLMKAHDRSLREEVKKTYERRGSEGEFDNTEVVKAILVKRHEIARLLGFDNHAERTIRPDTRMAENPDTVIRFLKKNASVYKPAAEKFYQELNEFARKRDGIKKLESWDRFYYIEQMRKEKIGYDPKSYRPYFELENVLQGMFAHTEKLYGVKIREVDGQYSTMHEDVRTFEVQDAASGKVKALYYLDAFARDYKRGGAWMSDIRNAGLEKGRQQIPIAGNYCNFTKPAAGNPALLSADEVETLWHELGHACHNMMGEGTYPDITGINVRWDYVELPSQINECWAFKPEVLNSYANDIDTGNPMPQDMVDKLQKLKTFDSQWIGIRQTELALLDMALYTTDPSRITDLAQFQEETWKDTKINDTDGPPMALTFSHIIAGGYSAGYYSYKWADALVADVFEQFEKGGLYNGKLCKAFREKMIKPGGTRPPADMHKDFMEAAGEGRRNLDAEAMFRAEGLLPASGGGPKRGKPPGPNQP